MAQLCKHLLKQVVVTRNKAGGSAVENIDIPLPVGTRTIGYGNALEGTGNALSNQLLCRVELHDGVVDVVQANNIAIFSNVTTNQARTSVVSVNVGGTHARWTIQANAATSNEFALILNLWGV